MSAAFGKSFSGAKRHNSTHMLFVLLAHWEAGMKQANYDAMQIPNNNATIHLLPRLAQVDFLVSSSHECGQHLKPPIYLFYTLNFNITVLKFRKREKKKFKERVANLTNT